MWVRRECAADAGLPGARPSALGSAFAPSLWLRVADKYGTRRAPSELASRAEEVSAGSREAEEVWGLMDEVGVLERAPELARDAARLWSVGACDIAVDERGGRLRVELARDGVRDAEAEALECFGELAALAEDPMEASEWMWRRVGSRCAPTRGEVGRAAMSGEDCEEGESGWEGLTSLDLAPAAGRFCSAGEGTPTVWMIARARLRCSLRLGPSVMCADSMLKPTSRVRVMRACETQESNMVSCVCGSMRTPAAVWLEYIAHARSWCCRACGARQSSALDARVRPGVLGNLARGQRSHLG